MSRGAGPKFVELRRGQRRRVVVDDNPTVLQRVDEIPGCDLGVVEPAGLRARVVSAGRRWIGVVGDGSSLRYVRLAFARERLDLRIGWPRGRLLLVVATRHDGERGSEHESGGERPRANFAIQNVPLEENGPRHPDE